MEQLLAQFLEHLRYERNVSEHTLRNYAIDLAQFLEHLAPADARTGERRELDMRDIDHITIREWMSELHSEQKKKTSIARKLAALRTFFQFLMREGVVEANPAKLVSTPRLEKKLPTHLSVEDAVRFIETPDVTTDLGKRDRAILEMLYGTGVRVSELVKLDIKDVDFRGRMIRVKGKRRGMQHHGVRRQRHEISTAHQSNDGAVGYDYAFGLACRTGCEHDVSWVGWRDHNANRKRRFGGGGGERRLQLNTGDALECFSLGTEHH